MNYKLLSMLSGLFMAVATAGFSADVKVRMQSGALSFSGGSGFTNAVLKISGPDDFEAEETSTRGMPVFRTRGGRMKDGFYQFTLTAATDEQEKIKKPIDNGRGSDARDYTLKSFHMSGIFEVKRGLILPQKELAAGADGDAAEE